MRALVLVLLFAAPSLARIENVGATSLPSCTKRTAPLVTCSDVKLVASDQNPPSNPGVNTWNMPWVTPETV